MVLKGLIKGRLSCLIPTLVFILAMSVSQQNVLADPIPPFQTHLEGSAAGDIGSDEDTWFLSGTPFILDVVGAANNDKIQTISGVTLVISVPQGETGTISFTSLGFGVPSLLTASGTNNGSSGGSNPATNANIDILTGVAGNDGYSTKNFIPASTDFGNHYPFQDDVSDFLLYDLGSFSTTQTSLNNYDADNGTITSENKFGQQKRYQVIFTGFSQLHFDAYGFFDFSDGGTSGWNINPGSHDSTAFRTGRPDVPAVPEPTTMLLMGTGIAGLLGRRLRSQRRP